MSIDGKSWNRLGETDKRIRQLFSAGPANAPTSSVVTIATIEVIGGFEAFNTRPYHNYETWGQGYRITSWGVSVEAEDLDVALDRWEQATQKKVEP